MVSDSPFAERAKDLPSDIYEEWLERVAIMMEGDGISEYRAEEKALEWMKQKYNLTHRGHKYGNNIY